MTDLVFSYLATNQYEAAATLCEQAIVARPQHLCNYWYLGLVRLLQGEPIEAQAVWLTAATEVDPSVVEAGWEELLLLLQSEAGRQLQWGQPHLAEQISWQALELDPSRSQFYLQLGNAVSLQGRLDEAIEHWQAAIELQPDLAEAYCRQAEVFQKLEQWDEAVIAYRQAIAWQPDWEAHYNLGLCLGKQQRWQAAIEQFAQAIQLEPERASAHGDRGWCQLQLVHWQAAIADFQASICQKSAYAETYRTWAATLDPSTQSSATYQRAEFLRMLCLPDAEVAFQAFGQFLQGQRHQNSPERVEPGDRATPNDSTNIGLSSLGPVSPPRFYQTTKEWAESQGISNHYIELDPPSSLPLNPPKTIDRSVHFSFRFGQAMPLPGTFVATIPDGIFWLNAKQTSNAVLTADAQLLGDLSPEFPLLSPDHPDQHPKNHSCLVQKIFPPIENPIEKIKGTVAVLSGLTNDMYFHWMFDVLPRLDLLHRSGFDFQQIDYFLVNHHLSFQRETLEILGVPEAKFLDTAQHSYIQADRLVVPSYPSSPAWMAGWACEWLRQIFLSPERAEMQGSDRLYITRQQTANRRIINESEVIACLSEFGFQSVALESLSVREQAALLAGAKVVVSPHGGGLTNTVFCQPGTKVIEIFSPHYVYPCYWLISNLRHLDYYYLTGVIPEGFYLHQFLYPDPRLEDILVDLDDLRHVLKLANVTITHCDRAQSPTLDR